MTCNFRVGQKVVCVETKYREEFLSEGAVYTIADVIGRRLAHSFDGAGYFTALVLDEVENINGFDARRFRPAIERGTESGMSILRNLLNKTDKPVEVDA